MGCTALAKIVDRTLIAAKNMDLTVDYSFQQPTVTDMALGSGTVVWMPRPGRDGTTLGVNTSGLFLGGLDHHVTMMKAETQTFLIPLVEHI